MYFRSVIVTLKFYRIIFIIGAFLEVVAGIILSIWYFTINVWYGILALLITASSFSIIWFIIIFWLTCLIKDFKEASDALSDSGPSYSKILSNNVTKNVPTSKEDTKSVVKEENSPVETKKAVSKTKESVPEIKKTNYKIGDKVVFIENTTISPYDTTIIKAGTEGVVDSIFNNQLVVLANIKGKSVRVKVENEKLISKAI